MTQHVFNNDMVAHVWAQQRQDSGRSNNGQFYFTGPTIYSYGSHFPIARFVANDRDEKAVLFTTREYSITTTHHKRMVHGAIPPGTPVFHTCNVERNPDQVGIMAEYAARFSDALTAARRAKTESDWKYSQAEAIAEEAQRCAEFFGLTAPNLIPDRAAFDAEYQEARRVSEARRAVLHAKRMERDQRRRAMFAASEAERLAKWRNGESVPTHMLPHDADRGAFLRVHGKSVETSRGASVPIDDAKRAFPLIARVRDSGKPWHSNGDKIRLGHFNLDHIDARGNVRAGCHLIMWPEIERTAAELGLIKAAA